MAPDPSQTLGEFLRHEREKRGITIEQVASATKISVRLLHALEADHYVDMPAKPFIRGFVTSYCRFVNLDPKEIITRFDRFIDSKSSERPSRDSGHSGYAFERREGEQSRTLLWIVMGVFIVIGAVLFLLLKPSFHHHHRGDLEKLKAAHGPSPSPLPVTTPGPVMLPPWTGPTPSAHSSSVPSPTPSASPTSAPASPSPKPTAAVIQSVPLVLAPTPLPTPSPSPSMS